MAKSTFNNHGGYRNLGAEQLDERLGQHGLQPHASLQAEDHLSGAEEAFRLAAGPIPGNRYWHDEILERQLERAGLRNPGPQPKTGRVARALARYVSMGQPVSLASTHGRHAIVSAAQADYGRRVEQHNARLDAANSQRLGAAITLTAAGLPSNTYAWERNPRPQGVGPSLKWGVGVLLAHTWGYLRGDHSLFPTMAVSDDVFHLRNEESQAPVVDQAGYAAVAQGDPEMVIHDGEELGARIEEARERGNV